jgi:Ice-binding-like
VTHRSASRKSGATALIVLTTTALLMIGGVATAAIVPTVLLGTSGNYSVLGGSTVTNTGNSVLNGSLGLSPGTSITGFPPGIVAGSIDNANGAAAQAQIDLTAAYVDAAGRVLNGTTTPNLGGLVLVGGVYAGPSKSPLSLTGNLTLDGAGDPNSVFIFQTDSTLTTASGSSVTLINSAQECNIFWQVGSSATLGTGSLFAGNILALTSITVTTGVTVHGRALARNGAVTLDTDTFILPTCDLSVPTTTSSTTTTVPGATTTAVGATTTAVGGATTAAPITGLPFTGLPVGTTLLAAFSAFVLGAILIRRGKTLRD